MTVMTEKLYTLGYLKLHHWIVEREILHLLSKIDLVVQVMHEMFTSPGHKSATMTMNVQNSLRFHFTSGGQNNKLHITTKKRRNVYF